jgi:hypothetical protein
MLATIVPVATSEPLTLLKIAQRVQAEHGKPMRCRIEMSLFRTLKFIAISLSKMIVARVP